MSDGGTTAAVRASAILLGAALLRGLATPTGADPEALSGRPSLADSLVAAGDSIAKEQERRNRPMEPGERLDVNRATDVDLDRLPGIGPAKAAQIVADRNARGPFRTLEDLARVQGLGERTLERLAPFLSVPSGAGRARSGPTKDGFGERRLLGVEERPASSASTARVRLNTATKDELETLPGIGPVLAQRIVDFRNARGGFRSTRELMEVPGVGPATYARLRTLVTVP